LCAATAAARNSKLDTHSCSREHVDERVDAEQIDFPANKIANAWLGDPKEIRCRALRQFARLDETPDSNHQLRAKPQALGLLRSESQVAEHVPARLLNLHYRVSFLPRRLWSSSLNRDLAKSKLYLAVFLLFFSKA
jgi:hypothetical protein